MKEARPDTEEGQLAGCEEGQQHSDLLGPTLPYSCVLTADDIASAYHY